MKVKDVMSAPVFAVKPVDTIAHAKKLMLRNKVKRLVVVDKGKPTGVVTMHDIADMLRTGAPTWRRRPIDEIPIARAMHEGIIWVALGTDIGRAANLMLGKGVSSLLVIDGEAVAGILTKTDITRYFSESHANKFKVRELMSRDFVTATRMHSLARVVELMEEFGVRRVLVVAGEKLVGLISETDVALAQLEMPAIGINIRKVKFTRRTEYGGRPWARYVKYMPFLTAEDIMRKDPVTIGPNEDAAAAASLMIKRRIGAIPVVEDGKLQGIITKTDIARAVGKLGV